MADNVPFSPNPSVNIATDDISGVQYQIVKLAAGVLDSATLVSNTNPLPAIAPTTGTAAYGAVAVGTSATSIRGTNNTRVGLTIQNLGSVDIFWGHNSSVTTSNGLKLGPGGALEIDSRFTGPLYGITATSSADVRYWEVG